MNKYLLTGVVILACICIVISIAYACLDLDIDSDYKVYVKVDNTVYVDAWVYAGGPVYTQNGWIWTWPAAFGDDDQYDTEDESTSWSVCDTAGAYEIRVDAGGPNGEDSDTTQVYVIDPEIEDNPPNRDTPEYTEYQTGMNVYYKIEPTSGWTPSDVRLYIEDSSSELIKYVALSNGLGEQTAYWDGKHTRGWWAEPGQYTAKIRVRIYGTYIWSSAHTFYVLDVEITEPDGDPDYDHQFSFNSASPGVCSIPETGYLTGTTNTDIPALDADLKWTLSDHPSEPTGPQVTFTYTGLPSSNSGFGEKTLTLEYSNTGIKDTKTIEIFFEPTATNHPGAGSGTTPNWFYYWQNTGVISTDFEYDPDPEGEHPWGWFNDDNEQLYLGPNAIGPDWDPTANGWPDNTVVFTNHYYHTTINSGGNGFAQTYAQNDDYQVVPYGSQNTPFSTIITWDDPNPNAGENDWMDSADDNLGGDDELDLTDALTETNTYGNTGIDLVVVVCAHESQHKENYLLTGDDNDSDGIPDSHENSSGYYLNPDRPDTYNVVSIWPDGNYEGMGDDEFLCCMAEAGVEEVDSNIDWSKDGKQWHQP